MSVQISSFLYLNHASLSYQIRLVSTICLYLQRKLPSKLLLPHLTSAIRTVASPKHELTQMDCILLDICVREYLFDFALPYATRPIFGIASKSITTALLTAYFTNAVRICCSCGDYRSALSASKMVSFPPSFSFRLPTTHQT